MGKLWAAVLLAAVGCGGDPLELGSDAGGVDAGDAGPVCALAVGTGDCAPEAICSGAASIGVTCGGAICVCDATHSMAYALGQGSTCAQIHAAWLGFCLTK
jgi:hypothetical protein